MTRVRTEELGPVFRLVYRSRTLIAHEQREDQLAAIFEVSRWKNAGVGVTGALLAWEDAFVQVLEGDEPTVRGVYDTIRTDLRHQQVVMLDADTAPGRVFGGWSMARVGDKDGADIPVCLDRGTDGTTPAAVHTGDPGQDTMLELMRELARPEIAPPV